jgi:hypothetical protein
MKNPDVLNNIMNRDTYVTGKCAIILSEIVRKDFKKIYHNTLNEKINIFLKQTLDSLDRKVVMHLSMNNMDSLTVMDLDNCDQYYPHENYFFYKIDGLENFRRGINNFSITTGILLKGQIFCINIYNPTDDNMVWYQDNDENIYMNNALIWSPRSRKKTNRIKPMVALSVNGEYTLSKDKDYLIIHNDFLNFFLLMNDSVDQWVVDREFNGCEEAIFHYFKSINAINIESLDNTKVITKIYPGSIKPVEN